jgi:hypothetical protein
MSHAKATQVAGTLMGLASSVVVDAHMLDWFRHSGPVAQVIHRHRQR